MQIADPTARRRLHRARRAPGQSRSLVLRSRCGRRYSAWPASSASPSRRGSPRPARRTQCGRRSRRPFRRGCWRTTPASRSPGDRWDRPARTDRRAWRPSREGRAASGPAVGRARPLRLPGYRTCGRAAVRRHRGAADQACGRRVRSGRQPLQALAGGFALAFCCALVGALRETGQRAVVVRRLPIGVRQVRVPGLAAVAVIVAVGALLVGCRSGDACRSCCDGDEQSGRRGVGVVAHGIDVDGVPAERRDLGKCVVGRSWLRGRSEDVGDRWRGAPRCTARGSAACCAPAQRNAPTLARLAVARDRCRAPRGLAARAARVLTPDAEPWWNAARRRAWALAAGAVAGLAMGLLAWLSGGPLGPGRMATVGPSAWHVGIAVSG